MGSVDRAAATFGALHLGVKRGGRTFDFAELYERRRAVKDCEPVRSWLRTVRQDPAHQHLLALLRNPMVHATTRMMLYARVGEPGPWESREPHLDAPAFFLPGEDRSVRVVELLAEVTPWAERSVQAAVALIETGDGLPLTAVGMTGSSRGRRARARRRPERLARRRRQKVRPRPIGTPTAAHTAGRRHD